MLLRSKTRFFWGLAVLMICATGPTWGADAGSQPPANPPADSQPKTDKTGGSAAEATPTLASSLKLKLTNGVIDFVNGARRARISLAWQLLPLDPLLETAASQELAERAPDFDIDNRHLASEAWRNDLPPDLSPEWGVPGGLGALAQGLEAWHQQFLKHWDYQDPEAKQRVENFLRSGALTPRQYLSMLRDHQLLHVLLSSAGFRIDLKANDESLDVRSLPKAVQTAKWRVVALKFRISTDPDEFVYRYALTARMNPFDIVLPGSSADTIRLEARATWQPKDHDLRSALKWRLGVYDSAINFENIDVKTEPVVEDQLAKITKNGGPSRLETYIRFFGGIQLGDVVVQNLLGGTRNTSIISGGLISRKRVSSLIGVNLEPWSGRLPGVSPGFLLGLDPSDTNNFFAGVSARFDAITLSVGSRIAEEDRTKRTPPGKGTVLGGHWAGVLSFDLSRLLGGKKSVTQLPVKTNEPAGGELGLSSDSLTNNLAGFLVTVQDNAGGDKKGSRLRIIRVQDEAGAELPEKQRRAMTLHQGLQFLPAGQYHYNFDQVKDDVKVTVNGLPVTAERGPFGASDRLTELTITFQ
jgi:hypothetical protein